jgi:hypothetical protein
LVSFLVVACQASAPGEPSPFLAQPDAPVVGVASHPTRVEEPLPAVEPTATLPDWLSGTASPPRTPVPPTQPATAQPSATQAPPSPIPLPTLGPDEWMSLPVLPEISQNAKAILADGLERGNNPHVFSKIGDCESQTEWFLDPFDKGPNHYALGPYENELRSVLAYYQGSFARKSLAARRGFTAASLLTPVWVDRERCEKDESPLACELRVNRPSVAFIMLGTNDASNPPVFERRLREVIEYTLAQGVLPVLGTKADNLEGDHSLNHTIASLALEYDIPLWNYWAAVQPLPNHGLEEDGAHLTYAGPFYTDSRALRRAWPVRNLNALQVLQRVMESTGR